MIILKRKNAKIEETIKIYTFIWTKPICCFIYANIYTAEMHNYFYSYIVVAMIYQLQYIYQNSSLT